MQMDLPVVATGKTTATVILAQDQVDALRGSPGRGRVLLVIRYHGQEFRTSVSVYRGEWMLVVNHEMRDGGLIPGGTHRVEVARDDGQRTVDVPDDLAAALTAAGVADAFGALAFTYRKEHVRSVVDAKKPETRARRIASVVSSLQ